MTTVPMTKPDEAVCRSCGAAIIWAHTEKGKAAPFDAKPEMRAIIETVMALEDRGARTVAVMRKTYTSHFATCPNADQHRRRDREQADDSELSHLRGGGT